MEFIHTADWHLGFRFSQFSGEQNRLLQEAQWQTVESIFTYARQHKVPFIICAGDQFDNGETAPNEQLTRLFALIAGFPDINFIMIAGNHDPLTSNSVYSRIAKSVYPSNLYFADNRKVFEFKEYKLRFFACSLTTKNGTYNPLAWIAVPAQKGWFNIGVAHGSIKIEGKYNPEDFPIEPETIPLQKLDYCALGHWHSFFKVKDNTYYCGMPEATQFEKKGYSLHVKINKESSKPEVIKIDNLNKFEWLVEKIVVSNHDYQALLTKLRQKAGKNIIKKCKIGGYLSLLSYKKATQMLDIISPQYFQLFIINNISLKPTDSEIKKIAESEYLNRVIHKLLQMKEVNPSYPLSKDNGISITEVVDMALLKIYDFFSSFHLNSQGV